MKRNAAAFALSLLLMAACHGAVDDTAGEKTSTSPASAPAESARLTIVSIDPPSSRVGQTFNVQENGRSAFGLVTTGATPTTKIYFDSTPLETTYGNPAFITAFAPPDATAAPGSHTISLRDGERTSPAVQWVVSP